MIEALDERGPDSSGIAVYADRPATEGPPTLRLSLGADETVDWLVLGCSLLEVAASGAEMHPFGAGLVLDLPEASLTAVQERLAAAWPQVRVLGTGWNLRVLKDTGRPTDTCARYGIASWEGYLAVAHTRMATESAVTVLHSHPFVPARDLCVVHNGSFSNYATVRRHLVDDGVAFRLGQRLRGGGSLPGQPAAVRRRPRRGNPLGDEGDGRILHPRHHERRRDVRRPRRLRLQARGRGRDSRRTLPWPPNTGRWPSCRASPTPWCSSPVPRRSTRGAAERHGDPRLHCRAGLR